MGEAGSSSRARGGKRERNKAENREEILAAGRRVFADLGYEAATVRDVIGATSLAAGTFYNYFPDKESVLRALLDEKMAEMQRRAKQARHGSDTVEDIVRSTLAVSFAVLAEDREIFDLLRRNAGAIRVILNEPGFVANRDELARDLKAANRRDGAAPIDAEYLAAAIGGLAFEVAACAVDRAKPDLDAAAAFATSLVLGGLGALAPVARAKGSVRKSLSIASTKSDAPTAPRSPATPSPAARSRVAKETKR
jgi:AcrR family transcriptional regulator